MATRTTMLRGRELVNVAGESHYQDALGDLVGAGERAKLDTVAHLIPEPENEHDRNAVRVEIDGAKVGYLPRALAADYAPLITPIAARGRAAACEARIAGTPGSYGVFLRLPPPDDLQAGDDPARRF